jgi:hypothetical protein
MDLFGDWPLDGRIVCPCRLLDVRMRNSLMSGIIRQKLTSPRVITLTVENNAGVVIGHVFCLFSFGAYFSCYPDKTDIL